jgi:hypothetical protein
MNTNTLEWEIQAGGRRKMWANTSVDLQPNSGKRRENSRSARTQRINQNPVLCPARENYFGLFALYLSEDQRDW